MRQAATVAFDDGSVLDIVVDNRDLVTWDMVRPGRGWPAASEAPFLFQSFIAWAACRRTGLFAGTFDEFQAVAADVTVSEEVVQADPTSPAPGPG